MPGLRRLAGYLRPYRGVLVVTAVAAVVASVLDGFLIALLIPVFRLMFGVTPGEADGSLVERVVDQVVHVFTAGEAVSAGTLVLLVLGTVVVKNIASYAAGVLGVWIQESVTRDLRAQLFDKVLRLDLDYLQQVRGGQLSARMSSDVEQAQDLVRIAMQTVFGNGLLVMVYIVMLLALSWQLSLVILVFAPLIALATRPVFARVRRVMTEAAELRGDMTAAVNEAASGARLVRASVAEEEERRRFDASLHRHIRKRMRGEALSLLTHPISEVFAGLLFALLLVLGMGWGSVGRLNLSPEAFVAFLAVGMRMLPAVKRLAHFPAQAETSLAGVNRVFGVLDVERQQAPRSDEHPFPGLRERIEFDRVCFGYGDTDVVHDVSFTIERGGVVALVGASGAGKSTVLDLLIRFHDPRAGEIRIDGVPSTAIDRASLRSRMGVVSQEGIVFNRSVHDNIAYGVSASVTRNDVMEAARLARAHDIIARLPEGYDTLLGERGTRLSGGERQRIALARALLRQPEILVLDEATSALDAESEKIIRESMRDLAEGRTVFVVAHRAASVAGANLIVVMEGGRVVDSGSHHELLDRCATYRRLYDAALVG